MGTSRWKPLPSDLPDAIRDLAEQLRALLDREGMSLRRLAADSDVPYSLTTLQRFFSGRALPPPELLAVIARKCNGDPAELQTFLEKARQPSPSAHQDEPDRAVTTRPRRWRNIPGALRGRRRYVVAAATLAAAAAVALVATLLADPEDRRVTSPPVRPVPTPPSTSSIAPTRSPEPSQSRTPGTSRSRKPERGSDREPGPGGESAANPGSQGASGSRPSRRPSAPRSSGTQLVGNGTFSGTTSGWAAYDGVRIRTESNRLRADVPSGGSQLPDRHFRYADFPLRSGSSYSFRFDAAASSGMTIRVVVKYNPPPYTKTFDRTITLGSSMRRFSYRFTSSLSTSQGAIAFYAGGKSSDRVIRVDNVSLIRGG